MSKSLSAVTKLTQSCLYSQCDGRVSTKSLGQDDELELEWSDIEYRLLAACTQKSSDQVTGYETNSNSRYLQAKTAAS